MRKTFIALFVLAAVGVIQSSEASARGGGGFRGGGFRGRGFGGYGFGLYYGGYYPYAYNDYDDDGGCYLVRRRVMTPYGWRIRPVQVCG